MCVCVCVCVKSTCNKHVCAYLHESSSCTLVQTMAGKYLMFGAQTSSAGSSGLPVEASAISAKHLTSKVTK